MPLELGIWRVDGGVQAVEFGSLELESRLEDILDVDIARIFEAYQKKYHPERTNRSINEAFCDRFG